MNQREEVKIVRGGQKEWELVGHNREALQVAIGRM